MIGAHFFPILYLNLVNDLVKKKSDLKYKRITEKLTVSQLKHLKLLNT